MKTATEKLRQLLDERGVKWTSPRTRSGYLKTEWSDDVWEFTAVDTGHDDISLYAMHYGWITPEHAVEATLGSGECLDEGNPGDFCCSVCGVRMFTSTSDIYTMITSDGRTIIEHPNYCPNCGRRVKR